MKNGLLLTLALSWTMAAQAQTTAPLLRGQATAAYRNKQYQEAGQRYEQAFQQAGTQASAGDLYNAACSWALAGEPTKAFQALDRSIKAGWDDVNQLRADADFASLRSDKRWQPLLHKLEVTVAQAEAKLNQPLKRELTQILESDQGLRRQIRPTQEKYGFKSPQMDSLWQQMRRADDRNLPRVTAIIDQYGWPGKSLVGSSGSLAAFLVIQHSNLAIMQKYLPLMRVAAAKGEMLKQNLALLEDRVLTFQNKPQIYGSQLQTNQTTGKTEFLPIADEARVDERRASMGLEPLAEYAKGFGLDYKSVGK
jgi:hypothetical protein